MWGGGAENFVPDRVILYRARPGRFRRGEGERFLNRLARHCVFGVNDTTRCLRNNRRLYGMVRRRRPFPNPFGRINPRRAPWVLWPSVICIYTYVRIDKEKTTDRGGGNKIGAG